LIFPFCNSQKNQSKSSTVSNIKKQSLPRKNTGPPMVLPKGCKLNLMKPLDSAAALQEIQTEEHAQVRCELTPAKTGRGNSAAHCLGA
jgi:hypothetical protein